MKKNNLTFIACDKTYSESDIVMFGAPFDGTTSFRPGTRFATNQIRIDSDGIETYSPYLNVDIETDKSIIDVGDVELPFGNVKKALSSIGKRSQKIVNDQKKPFMIGGEHLVSLPQIAVLSKKYPDLHIIHFDAHADLRESYLGEKLSHATVMRRVFEITGKNSISQFGIRSGTKEEFTFAENNTYIEKFSATTISERLLELKDKPIYISLDLDVLDPSIFPGTGTPEPGGLSFKELVEAILSLKGFNIVGADVVELSPHYDPSGVSTAVAVKIIRELLCIM